MALLATAQPNLEVKHYRPAAGRLNPSWWRTLFAGVVGFRANNQRMQNKVLLVDDAVRVTGGRNIENTFFDHSTTMNFRDRDVVAVGPAVRGAVESFHAFWGYREAVASRDLVRGREDTAHYAGAAGSARAGEDFDRDAESLSGVEPTGAGAGARLAREKSGATHSDFDQQICVDRQPVRVFGELPAAQRLGGIAPAEGARVQAAAGGAADVVPASSGNGRTRDGAGEAGKTVRPFRCVHAKSLVVHGRLAFVGCHNLDPRSEDLNTEVGLLMEDEAFAADLGAEIEHETRTVLRSNRPRRPWRRPTRILIVTTATSGRYPGRTGCSRRRKFCRGSPRRSGRRSRRFCAA